MRIPSTMLAIAAAVLLVGGCSSGADTPARPEVTVPPAAPASSTSAGPPASPAVAGATPADPSQSTTDLGPAVATRTASHSGYSVTLTLYPVVRSGTTSSVNFTLSAPEGASIAGLQVSDMLTDGDFASSDATGHAADGLSLVDGKNSKLYLVASDGEGKCLCSRDLSRVFLNKNLPVIMYAIFAAPPADITTVDMRIPTFGTIRNVPVQ
jgi:hypothetical protein